MDFWNWDSKLQSALISVVIALISFYLNMKYTKNRDRIARKNILLDNFKKDFLTIKQDAIRIWYTEPPLRNKTDIQLLTSNLAELLKDYQSEAFKEFYKILPHTKPIDLVIPCRRCFTENIENSVDQSKETHLTEMVNKIFQSLNIR